MTRRTLLTLSCFAALAVTTALILAGLTEPRIPGTLVAAAVLATLAGGSGIVRRRSWPLALFLLPLGAYLLARLQLGLPAGTAGIHAQAAFYARHLGSAAATYVHEAFPLDAGPAGVRLLVSLVVYGVVGAAALVGLGLRRPLPAVVILLCLAGFGFTTDEAARAPLPALAFVVLAGGLLALTRPLPRERVRLANALAGGVTATLAAVLALSILGVTTVEAGRPLRDWRTWELVGPQATTFDFDWMQNYPQLLAQADNAIVMKVRSPVASYWRANALSEFTGTEWISAYDPRSVEGVAQGGSWTYDLPFEPGVEGRTATEEFDVQDTYTDHLFAGGSPLRVTSPLRLDLSTSDAGDVSVSPARGPKTSYTVTAFVPDLGPTDLEGRGRYYPDDVAKTDLQLPFPSRAQVAGPDAERRWKQALAGLPYGSEWNDLYALNERIVGDESDPYTVAMAIQEYLRTEYQYSLHPAAASDSSPYAAFLFQTRSGYCQHFAGAMAMLLRFNGIPARVALGFRQGRQDRSGVYVVRRADAHAWVEAYFPGLGWAPFDPTPGSQLPSASLATVGSTGSAATSGSGTLAEGGRGTVRAGRARVADPGGLGTAAPTAGRGHDSLPWLVAIAGLLVAWPAGRALLLRRGLLRASAEDRVRASMMLLYALLADHGVDLPPSQTLDETARLLHDRFGLDAGDVVGRVQAIAFGGRTAAEQDVADLARLRRRLRATLRARSGRLRSLAAAYGLRGAPRRDVRPSRPAVASRPL
ncbi:MAG TPA: transglutaminaseTgpA domain-containing protein [Thermoleophilia bacterium]|nr:transglutaminaseTgpA domain-containing protein [Thermoleophilia bacterium]